MTLLFSHTQIITMIERAEPTGSLLGHYTTRVNFCFWGFMSQLETHFSQSPLKENGAILVLYENLEEFIKNSVDAALMLPPNERPDDLILTLKIEEDQEIITVSFTDNGPGFKSLLMPVKKSAQLGMPVEDLLVNGRSQKQTVDLFGGRAMALRIVTNSIVRYDGSVCFKNDSDSGGGVIVLKAPIHRDTVLDELCQNFNALATTSTSSEPVLAYYPVSQLRERRNRTREQKGLPPLSTLPPFDLNEEPFNPERKRFLLL